MIISLIGPPCVGKGTQSRILQNQHSFYSIGAGDLLRHAAKHDPECAKVLETGQLISVEYIWALMEKEIESQLAKHNTNILLDGYPRELSQAAVLDTYLKANQQKITIINMQADDQELINRMHKRVFCDICGATATKEDDNDTSHKFMCCGKEMSKRNDDNDATFQERLDIFNHNIGQVRGFYADKSTCRWIDFDANLSIEEVHTFFEHLIANKK